MKPPERGSVPFSRLFTYGTLVFPEVMSAVTGRTFSGRPATLPGFSRYLVLNQIFPAIVAESDGRTPGVLYEEVDAAALRMLDRFEGELYRRRSVLVSLESGQTLQAQTYVAAGSRRHGITSEPWDPRAFAAAHLPEYLRACREWKTRGGPAGA